LLPEAAAAVDLTTRRLTKKPVADDLIEADMAGAFSREQIRCNAWLGCASLMKRTQEERQRADEN
jgi:hypothetical protein